MPRDQLEAILRENATREAEKIGHNVAHILVQRANGKVEDLGYHPNLLTNTGRDLIAAAQGHATGKGGALTASSATSATPSGGGMTTDQYKGWRVYCPITGITTEPVYGNIGSNSTTVLTVDQWWNAIDGSPGTPAATNGYSILPAADFRFMALTTDAGAASAADATLTSEITTNGGSRALATYAHTGGTNTYTLVKAFSFTGTLTSIQKIGLFNVLTLTAAGVMGYEVVFTPVLTVGNGDTGTITWTGTLA
jgi:hypothetical protein